MGEFIPSEYTGTMTLILGKVCDDGVILAADSKGSYPGTEPYYDKQKIFPINDGVALAIAGTEMLKETPSLIAGSLRVFMRRNRSMLGIEAAEYIREYGALHLFKPKTEITVFVADSRNLYAVFLHTGIIEQGYGFEGGIKHVKHVKEPDEETTKAYTAYYKALIKLNEGETVGGKPQVAILNK